MKAKVLKEFRDKYTGTSHKPEEVIDISEKRFAEILTVAPLVEALEVPTTEEIPVTEEIEKPKKATKKKSKK